MSDENRTTPSCDLERAEALIVGRLKRYAANSKRGLPGKLDAAKVICIVRERFEFVRSGKLPAHDAGRGERRRIANG